MSAPIVLGSLTFTGPHAAAVELRFGPHLSVLYGASNTGKSFALKALDFMLGGSRTLPGINERVGYDTIWLALTLPNAGAVTLARPIVGGPFELYTGHVISRSEAVSATSLSEKHDHKTTDNLSNFLLDQIGLGGRLVAAAASGTKRSLSFRDLVRFCIVDETTIQSENSPAHTGQRMATTLDQSVFKLLITGEDDRAVVTVLTPAAFKAKRMAKLEEVEAMLEVVEEQLANEFPNREDLQERIERVEATLQAVQSETELAHQSVVAQIAAKTQIVQEASARRQRRGEVGVNIGRFRQLQSVYESDVERLEALEEVGFLLMIGADEVCPLCGAPPTAQRENHGLREIDTVRSAALVEIGKIRQQSTDLRATIEQLEVERTVITGELGGLENRLQAVDAEIARLTPIASTVQRRLNDTLALRDIVKRGLALLERQKELKERRDELVGMKPASKADRPTLGVPSTVGYDFARKVSEVLDAWRFPGDRHVSFDEKTFDLKIDGKLRRDNGKGVRAITHAAFKVALLLFCRERNLPHPGFLLLDTPLLTYRDPIRSKGGPLSPDEAALKETSLMEHFFVYFASMAHLGQFVIVENIDPPAAIVGLAEMETFTGDPAAGRTGLFPPGGGQAAVVGA